MLRSALLARHHRRNRASRGKRMNLIVNGMEKVVDLVGGHRKGFGLWPHLQPYLTQQRLR